MSLTVAEVAKEFGVCVDVIYDAIKAGRLEAWRPSPQQYRIEPEAIEAWKRATRTKAPKRRTFSGRLQSVEGGRR